jgi:hypothetical protein
MRKMKQVRRMRARATARGGAQVRMKDFGRAMVEVIFTLVRAQDKAQE